MASQSTVRLSDAAGGLAAARDSTVRWSQYPDLVAAASVHTVGDYLCPSTGQRLLVAPERRGAWIVSAGRFALTTQGILGPFG